MSDPLSQKRHRREPMELQLTAMIDIFSMIVIFLILGSVFGASEMVFPKGMILPRSTSKESAESAVRLVIARDQVQLSLFAAETIPMSVFETGDANAIGAIKAKIKAYLDGLPKEGQPAAKLLNVIADKDTPYREVFNVIRVFREAGFESLLFVAMGEEKSK